MFLFYTDGSCTKNRTSISEGGYSVVILQINEKNNQYVLIDYYNEQENNVTNNQMELKGIIKAFEYSQIEPYNQDICMVYTDSKYCVNICNKWLFNWVQNGWKRYNNIPLENLSLLQTLYKYYTIDFFNCQVKWVKGHSNNIGNELADALARDSLQDLLIICNKYNIKIEVAAKEKIINKYNSL